MYLAPLNYDRYFRKVFSDLEISKQFLNDFLDVEIESIEMLDPIQKMTDKSIYVEFDFRCKINGQYVIIDMQQWYKSDVVKRFYVYHCANTVLQLEHLLFKERSIKTEEIEENKRFRNQSYHSIEPVITLIWMVDDTLNFTDDFVSYRVFPQKVVDFIQNETLWHTPNIVDLANTREELLKILGNKSKNLDFLPENQMTYIFQKNIIKNKNFVKYARWFDFAEKTKNKNNTQEDFTEFLQDKIFLEIMRRINKEVLKDEDFSYMRTQEERKEEQERYERELKEQLLPEVMQAAIDQAMEELKEEVKEQVREEVKEEVKEQVREEVKEEVKEQVKIQVREELKEEVKEQVREEVKEEVKEQVREEVKEEVKEQVREEVKEEVKEQVKEQIREELKEEAKQELTYQFAQTLLKDNKTYSEVAKYTQLSLEKIAQIAKNMGL